VFPERAQLGSAGRASAIELHDERLVDVITGTFVQWSDDQIWVE